MMIKPLETVTFFCASAVAALLMAAAPTPARAQPDIDPDAAKVLSQMQAYLGGLKSFTVKYDSDFDVLMPTGAKLKFLSSGEIAVQRPDKLYATRTGALADVSLTLDGKQLTLLGKGVNAYIQLPASSIDEAIDVVRDQIGLPAPGADLIASKPFDLDATDVMSATHVGMTTIDGVKVHHLAFRGAQTDWQIWVKDGDQPLPLRYVITNKWTTGAPEYSLTLSDWNVAPKDDASVFAFTPPAGAKKLSSITISETGEITGTQE